MRNLFLRLADAAPNESKKEWLIKGERALIGRDAACDIVLSDPAISRNHAYILCRLEQIYIENVSVLSKISVNGKVVEFAPLLVGDKIKIAHLTFTLVKEEATIAPQENNALFAVDPLPNMAHFAGNIKEPIQVKADARPPAPLEQDLLFQPEDSADDLALNAQEEEEEQASQSSDHEDEDEAILDAAEIDDSFLNEIHSIEGDYYNDIENQSLEGMAADAQSNEQGELSILDMLSDSENGSQANSLNEDDQAIEHLKDSPGLDTDDATMIFEGNKLAVLKFISGASAGKSFKLSNGRQWLLGRDSDCEVIIDDDKIQDKHARIYLNNGLYMIEIINQDATLLVNGDSVDEQALIPDDKIMLGDSELEFSIEDPHAIALATEESFRVEDMPEQTRFHSPQVYMPPTDSFVGSIPQSGDRDTFAHNDSFFGAPHSSVGINPNATPSNPQQNNLRPILIFILLTLGGYGAWLHSEGQLFIDSRAPANAKQATILKKSPPPLLPDERGQGAVSPEFLELSEEKKNEIRSLYSQAGSSLKDKNWKNAFNASKAIADMVHAYRDNNEILQKSQEKLSQQDVERIQAQSSTENATQQAAKYLADGETALKEKRWNDAEDLCYKAYGLDATNDAAFNCALAAGNQTENLEAPPEEVIVEVEVERKPSSEELAQQEADQEMVQLEALERQLEDATNKMNIGNFAEAMPLIKSLDSKLSIKMSEYSAGRLPSSVQNQIIERARVLQEKVISAYDNTTSQLDSQFQTSLIDADQYRVNKQYDKARVLYDQILESVPAYDKAFELRQELYGVIISDARGRYQEALIYESIGRIAAAKDGYTYTENLLNGVEDLIAQKYYKKAKQKLELLGP